MSRGRHRMGRRRRDLQRTIAAQLEEIAFLQKALARVSDDRDRLMRGEDGSGEETAHIPRPVLLDETTEIPVILPDGRTFTADVHPRRPSWARSD